MSSIFFFSSAYRARSSSRTARSIWPFENCSLDLAVAYNVLMDVEDVPAALKEIKRVLRSSGTLVISIVHPFADRGRFAGPETNAPFVLQKSYFGRERFEDTEVRNGLEMHFAGWSQPLESYMAALENAGLAITSLREPVPDTAAKGSHMERIRLPDVRVSPCLLNTVSE